MISTVPSHLLGGLKDDRKGHDPRSQAREFSTYFVWVRGSVRCLSFFSSLLDLACDPH